MSYQTSGYVSEKFSIKWVLRKYAFDSVPFTTILRQILPSYENFKNAQGYLLQKLKKITQQGTIKRRLVSSQPRALNQNDEKSNCKRVLRATWNEHYKETERIKYDEALMCPNLQCTGHREERKKIPLKLLKSLMVLILGRFFCDILACGEILKWFLPISDYFLKLRIQLLSVVLILFVNENLKTLSVSLFERSFLIEPSSEGNVFADSLHYLDVRWMKIPSWAEQ